MIRVVQGLAVVSVLAAGCATTSWYQVPRGPQATIELFSNAQRVVVQTFDDERCLKSRHGIRLAYLHDKYGSPTRGQTMKIQAGVPLVVSATWFRRGLDATRCSAAIRFTPEPGQKYKIIYMKLHRKCRLNAFRLYRRGGRAGWEQEQTVTELQGRCFSGDG